MASLNKVLLIGNLTRDPEVRYTPKGSAVCDLGLAVNRRYTTESGERQEEVTFLDVVLWGKQAELAGQYLHKGRAVFIEGRLQMDTWEDKTTQQKRSKIKIVCENMQFIDSKGGGGQRGGDGGDHGDEGGPPARSFQRPAAAGARPPQRPQAPPSRDEFNEGPITEGMEEDDIPF
ncbi:MAG: single-stranded DNA-binding protein [Verrucomicrobiaceae bacterium]|nr:single-stranded DNA-binding protein [Verrucomicrobiaceae bacterium]